MKFLQHLMHSHIKYDPLRSFPHSRNLFIYTFNTEFSLECFCCFINVVFHLFFCFFFWAHNEKHSFTMIINANIYIIYIQAWASSLCFHSLWSVRLICRKTMSKKFRLNILVTQYGCAKCNTTTLLVINRLQSIQIHDHWPLNFAVTHLNIFTCRISVSFASSPAIIHLVSHASCVHVKETIGLHLGTVYTGKFLLAGFDITRFR